MCPILPVGVTRECNCSDHHFFQNIFYFVMLFAKCNIFYMKLVQYNERLINIVDTDGLVL